MEASQTNPNSANSLSHSSISHPLWPTIDGSLGLSEEESLRYARSFFKFGFALLPWLWAVNCFYFWPVLRHSHSFPRIRRFSRASGMKERTNGVASGSVCFLVLTLDVVLLCLLFVFGDVVGSAIGFLVFTAILSSWALTFAIGGERLFGHVWDKLVMYNVADELGLTSWS